MAVRPSWGPEYRSEYGRRWRHENPAKVKASWDNPVRKAYRHLKRTRFSANLRLWKGTQGCAKCDITEPLLREYHHREGTEKRYNICDMGSMSLEALLDEIAKCDVLCAACHRQLAVLS